MKWLKWLFCLLSIPVILAPVYFTHRPLLSWSRWSSPSQLEQRLNASHWCVFGGKAAVCWKSFYSFIGGCEGWTTVQMLLSNTDQANELLQFVRLEYCNIILNEVCTHTYFLCSGERELEKKQPQKDLIRSA